MDVAVVIGLVLAAAAAVAAVVVVPPARRSARKPEVEQRVAEFRRRLRDMKDRQNKVNQSVLDRAPAAWKAYDLPLLAKQGWIFKHPIPLDAEHVRLSFVDDKPPFRRPVLDGLDLSGPIGFADAVVGLAGMAHFTNGVIYRLLGLDVDDHTLRMTFGEGGYFDYLDTGEVLAYKEFEAWESGRDLPALTSPFDFTDRAVSVGVLTLTVRRGGPDSPATFLMHKRTSNVVTASDLYHVIPAGEFTPSDIGRSVILKDLDLWKNICREYAEELCGDEDAQGTGGRRIDYGSAFPYRQLNEAVAGGKLRVYVLGVGLDPATRKPELLTTAIFDDGSFDDIFTGKIIGNYEGKIIEDEPLEARVVRSYTENEKTRSGAKACLELVWQHRVELGLT